MRVTTTNLISTLAPLFVTIAAAAAAQPDREDETSLEEVVVTGSFASPRAAPKTSTSRARKSRTAAFHIPTR